MPRRDPNAPPPDHTARAAQIAEAYERFHGLGNWQGRPQSYRQIAKDMGTTHPTAAKWVREGEVASSTRDTVEQLVAKRALLGMTGELVRYGAQLLGMDDDDLTPEERLSRWDLVMPDLNKAIDQAAKLTGAYAPVRSEVAMTADANLAINQALDARRADHQARLAAERRRQIEGT